MIETIRNAWKIPELRKKILFTVFALLVFRLGSVVPVPFIDSDALSQTMNSMGGIFSLLGAMNGTAFSIAAVFALGVQPYINSSIIIQLLTVAIPALERLQKEGGEEGRKKIAAITRYVTVAIGLLQGFGYYTLIRSYNATTPMLDTAGLPGWWAAIVIILCFTAGSAFVMWLGEQITEFGIGNGISIILFAGIPANDRLFDTLDTTTRRLKVSDHLEILLSDTVGFIAKLPHHLIEAFQATLEELQYADLLLHVIDASDPHREAHIEVVDRLIDKLAKPGVPVLRCYNKADLVGDVSNLPIGEKNIPMCARSGIGMDELLTRIEETLTGRLHRAVFLLPYSDAGALAQLHEQAQVLRVDYLPEGVEVEAVCREELFGRLKRFVKEPEA